MTDLPSTAPYVRGSSTSKAAAKKIARFLSGARSRVFDAIALHGPLADHEVAELLSMNIRTAAPRRVELHAAGFVEDSGQRATTKGGSSAVRWRAVPMERRGHALDDYLERKANTPAKWRDRAVDLWDLLDLIDTLDDVARNDDAAFRAKTREVVKRRHEILTSDGWALSIPVGVDAEPPEHGNIDELGENECT